MYAWFIDQFNSNCSHQVSSLLFLGQQSCSEQLVGKEHVKQLRRHKEKTAQVESQQDSSFPIDGHQIIYPKQNEYKVKEKQKTDAQWQLEPEAHGPHSLTWVNSYKSFKSAF